MGGKHSGKDASSSSKKSKSKPKGSGSWSDQCLKDDQPHERVAQGLPSGRRDPAAAMAQWDVQFAAASSKKR
ncbi:hypothetical protein PG995_011696 [Apiospora arundinis]